MTFQTLLLADFVATLLALAMGWWRGPPPRGLLRDLGAAWLAALGGLALAAALFALARPLAAAPLWRQLGSWALVVSPLASCLALRLWGRRSLPRALALSALAALMVVFWLTSRLKGPRGDWTVVESVVTVAGAAVFIGSAACLGWWSKRRRGASAGRSLRRLGGFGSTVAVWLAGLGCLAGCGARGTRLELTLRDATDGEPTAARVELLDETGRSVVPSGALEIFDDCGSLPLHNWVPAIARLQVAGARRREVDDPYTGRKAFYSDGSTAARLPPGKYTARATKGIEYRIATGEVTLGGRGPETLELTLERWSNLPLQGWYGADDHLHIPRPHRRVDPAIATWMQAEDLHVANLLQMGLARDVHITPQRRFGPASVYREGDTIIVTGQENPRTHVLGHSIILGARRWVDFPPRYPLYDRFWREAHEQGAINGFAHWALGGAEDALALWAHDGLLDFIEVLNLGLPFYGRWYEALNLGIRIGPTAGTDYPCLPSLPGRERFYARPDGRLDLASWLAAVRHGRTFVTNGPILDLSAGGAGIGGEARLAAPGSIDVRGSVRFDPERDDVEVLELVRAGEVVLAVEAGAVDGEIRLEAELPVAETTWVALRARGSKRAETPLDARALLESLLVLERRSSAALLASVPAGPLPRPSAAHTGAIFVTIEGTPPLADQPRARAIVADWLDRLAELEGRFAEDRLPALAGFPGRGDGIDEHDLRRNRAALLAAIDAARRYYDEAAIER